MLARPSETPQTALGWVGGRALRIEQTTGRALRLGHTWEVADWEYILGKLPLGKMLLGSSR